MEWGNDLFDRYEELMKHLGNSIEFMELIIRMNTERAKVEAEYAKNMKRMVQRHALKKKDDYGGDALSYETAYSNALQEINSIALQHEVISDNLKQSVTDPTTKAMQELKKAKQHFATEFSKMERHRNKSQGQLENAYKRYRSAHIDMLKAEETYKAAEENRNLARVEVDRQKQYAETKRSECERLKSDYAAQLESTNKVYSDFYRSLLPALLNDMQRSDKQRTETITQSFMSIAESESSVMHTISTCHEGVVNCAKSINWQKDSDAIVDTLRSGYPLPGEIPFRDLDTVAAAGSSESITSTQTSDKGTLRQKNQKRSTFPWFSKTKEELGPEQKRKKINQRIKETQTAIAAEEKKKLSMQNLQKTFANNTQNASKIQVEIDEADQRLQGLKEELGRLEAELNELMGGGNGSTHQSNGQLANSSNSGGTDRSSTVTVPVPAPPADPVVSTSSARSEDDYDDFADEFGDEPPAAQSHAPFVGGCTAIYPFTSEDGSGLNMNAGDQFYVLQVDSGDGWTLVTTLDSSVQGYVPSGYLEIQPY